MPLANFEIGGMSCESCARAVQKKLSSLAGVESARVELAGKSAAVTYADGAVTTAQMAAAVEKLGYSARLK